MSKTRHATAISSRIRKLLNPKAPEAVKVDDDVSEYVKGGQFAIDAFYVEVMNPYPPFERDGLDLSPAEVRPKPKVYHVIAATIRNYERRGWKVIW